MVPAERKSPIRVLHIDDDPGFLELVRFFLTREGGFEVDSAEDGRSGLEKFEKGDFQALVVDYKLPDISGIDVLKILRARGHDVPVIIFTGKGREETAIEALNSGADFYIQKGTNPKLQFAELAHVLRQVVATHTAEKAVREAERLLSSVFACIQDGISVLDKDLNIVRVNHAMEEWYSHALPLVGKKCYEAYHGRDAPCEVCPSLQTLRTGALAHEVVPKVGEGRKVVGWLDLYSFPLFDERTRELVGVIEHVRDISEQKKARDELVSKERMYAEYLSQLHEIAFCADGDFRPMFMKGAVEEITGYTEEDFLSGRVTFQQLIHPEDRPETDAIAKRLQESPGLTFDHEFRLIGKDGKVRWINEVIKSVKEPGGTGLRIHGTMRDVTERKRYERALEQANAKLNLLGHITRHDALNELSVLVGWLQVAQDMAPEGELASCLRNMRAAADHLRDHLEFTAEYQRLGIAKPEWVAVGEAFTRASSEVSHEQIEVVSEIDGLEVYADPMLVKVFRNLIENTIRHGRKATTARLRSFAQGEDVLLVYEDDGVGVPPERKRAIFEHGEGSHTGLGLFMAREILAITGITIEEDGEFGKSARFVMRVPAGNHRTVRPASR